LAVVFAGWVPSRRVSDVCFTSFEGPVEVIISRHNELTPHFVKLMLTHGGRTIRRVSSGAYSYTELFERYVLHPFGVVDVRTRDVGGDISSDGVAGAVRAMWVEFSSIVALRDVQGCQVTVSKELDVCIRLDV